MNYESNNVEMKPQKESNETHNRCASRRNNIRFSIQPALTAIHAQVCDDVKKKQYAEFWVRRREQSVFSQPLIHRKDQINHSNQSPGMVVGDHLVLHS